VNTARFRACAEFFVTQYRLGHSWSRSIRNLLLKSLTSLARSKNSGPASRQSQQLRAILKISSRNNRAAKCARHIAGDGVTVTLSAVKGRPAYDMKAIREAAVMAGIALIRFETTGEPSDRLVISINNSTISGICREQSPHRMRLTMSRD
jgi:hypothetical protein